MKALVGVPRSRQDGCPAADVGFRAISAMLRIRIEVYGLAGNKKKGQVRTVTLEKSFRETHLGSLGIALLKVFVISRKNGPLLSQLFDRRRVFAHFGFQEACFLFRIRVHCATISGKYPTGDPIPRTSELGLEFVVILLGLL